MSVLDATALERFVADDPRGPVVMLNLMRFVPDGAAKYMQYIERFNSSGVNERYGVKINLRRYRQPVAGLRGWRRLGHGGLGQLSQSAALRRHGQRS